MNKNPRILVAELHGRNLIRLREEHSLTQWDLADAANVPRSTISALEANARLTPLSATQCFLIAKALGVPVDALFLET